MKKTIVYIFLSLVFLVGCGGGDSTNDSPPTIAYYKQKIEDVKNKLASDIAKVEQTFWGPSIEYYSFDFGDDGGLNFTNSGYGLSIEYSNPHVEYYDKNYNTVFSSYDYDYTIDADDKLSVTITHDGTTSNFNFTPNKAEARVQGDFVKEDGNVVGYFETTRDGREALIQLLQSTASKQITSYEVLIDALIAQENNSVSDDDTTDGDTSNSILSCGDKNYIFNSTAVVYAGTYHLATNEKSTLVLNSSGTGSELVFKLGSSGIETNTIDYDVTITSWGLLVDSSGNYIKSSTDTYYLITATNDPNHTCMVHLVGTNSLDYWYK